MTLQGPIPKVPKHGRIKAKKRKANAREKRFHIWLMENYACFCGCEGFAEQVHHPLDEHPEQETRRNHEYVLPVTFACHDAVHRAGSEAAAFPGCDATAMAAAYRADGYAAGVL